MKKRGVTPAAKSAPKRTKKPVAKHVHPKAKFSFRRQVLPPLLGLAIMLSVAGFLNGEWIAAQLYYRFSEPVAAETSVISNIKLDPNAPPEISIPSIRVKAPVISVPSVQEQDVQRGLRDGVVKFPGTADPGQTGNAVMFGHSSGRPFAPGNYKFVFALLNKVEPGQNITVDYKGTRYIYKVLDRKVVQPTDVAVLDQTRNKHLLTLITCSPVGSNTHRLVVRAEQISPKPDNSPAVKTTISNQNANQDSYPSPNMNPEQTNQLSNGSNETVWQSIRNIF